MTTTTRILLAALIALSLVSFTTQQVTPVMPPRVEISD